MKYLIIMLVTIFSLFSANVALSKELYLMGGKNNEVNLGCITCSKYSSESVWNSYGTYGSKYSSNSIWNIYGTYGSKYNPYCPWNSYSNTAPSVVDKEGNFYGYFSTNKYISNRVTDEWLIDILDRWEWIIDNFDTYVNNLKLN
jgi:hypothetical protein